MLSIHVSVTIHPPSLPTTCRLTGLLGAAGFARLLAIHSGSQSPQEAQAPGGTW